VKKGKAAAKAPAKVKDDAKATAEVTPNITCTTTQSSSLHVCKQSEVDILRRNADRKY